MDGFAILVAWGLILGVIAFYKLTTPDERLALGGRWMGWLFVAMLIAGAYETGVILLSLTR